MSELTNKQIMRAAIDRYGHRTQIVVAIEELSELQKELTKYLRGKGNREHIIEEMADVLICIDELKEMLNITLWEVIDEETTKLKRLEQRLQEDEQNGER